MTPRTPIGGAARAAALGALVAVLGALPGGAALAAAPTAWYWYDGGVQRSLWLDATRSAAFSTRDPKAAVMRARPAGDATAAPAKASGGGSELSETTSPVFKDEAGDGGHRRALPGGVVATLREPMSDADARTLIARHGAVALRPIGNTGMWLVESPAGVASLELANRLHESGAFASASPNWWQPRRLK
jgi:hypothetical protein